MQENRIIKGSFQNVHKTEIYWSTNITDCPTIASILGTNAPENEIFPKNHLLICISQEYILKVTLREGLGIIQVRKHLINPTEIK